MKKVTLVMLALTAVMQLPAQEQGRTLSLEEALEMTLSDNPAIRAAEFNRRAAQQELRPAIGLRMPQIGITGSYAYLGKDIEIDLNNMKTPVQNLAGQILQSGMIPSDYIPSISQMLSGAMAASWALPLQDRSLGFVGGDVTVTGNGAESGGIPVESGSGQVGLDLLGELYRAGVFSSGAEFAIESNGTNYRIDEL